MRTHSFLALAIVIEIGLVTSACSDDGSPSSSDELMVPQVNSLSVTSAAVGEEITVYGSGFIAPQEGYTLLTLRGAYTHDGITEQVNLEVSTYYIDENTLTWRFGPYRIPFTSAGNHLGVFEGEIYATNVAHDERIQRQEEQHQRISLEVEPSLVVLELTAAGYGFEANCNFLGTRVINLVPYRLTVEAVGFDATDYFYSISGGLFGETGVAEGHTDVYHPASSNIDSLGVSEPLRFAEVPRGVPVYRASISMVAFSTTGEQHDVFLMLTVHQPISVHYDGNMETAEIMEPVPVSGCNPGGMQGRQLTYNETVSETRTIATSHTFEQGWEDTYTEGHTRTYGGSSSAENRIGFESSDTDHWSWNVWGEVMVGGNAGVPLVTNGKVEIKAGAGRTWGRSHTDSQQGQRAWTETTDYSDALNFTDQYAELIYQAESTTWEVSTTTSDLWGYSVFLIPNKYGVWYRQTTRFIRMAELVALDLCGNETVVGELVMNEYTWAADLGLGDSCPPLPESLLPEAVCLISPCEETRR